MGIEPHIPLVKDPVDPKTVSDPKRVPGIQARRRMKQRMKTAAYKLSQKCRKKVEEGFGWLKTVAGLDRCRTVGRWKLKQLLQIGAAAYNLVRDELRRNPTLLGLDKLLEAQIQVVPPERRADLELIKNLIHNHTRRVARYRCDACGFKARQFYWRCPGCGGWETYPPKRSEEFDIN